MKLCFSFLTSGCGVEADASDCAFLVSTYDPLPNQFLWNEAYCCPKCGEIWGRKYYDEGRSHRWAFEAMECGSPIISPRDLDYFLLLPVLSINQIRFLLHEYSRCAEHYRLDRSSFSARAYSSGSTIPDISEL